MPRSKAACSETGKASWLEGVVSGRRPTWQEADKHLRWSSEVFQYRDKQAVASGPKQHISLFKVVLERCTTSWLENPVTRDGNPAAKKSQRGRVFTGGLLWLLNEVGLNRRLLVYVYYILSRRVYSFTNWRPHLESNRFRMWIHFDWQVMWMNSC